MLRCCRLGSGGRHPVTHWAVSTGPGDAATRFGPVLLPLGPGAGPGCLRPAPHLPTIPSMPVHHLSICLSAALSMLARGGAQGFPGRCGGTPSTGHRLTAGPGLHITVREKLSPGGPEPGGRSR